MNDPDPTPDQDLDSEEEAGLEADKMAPKDDDCPPWDS